MSTTAMGRGRIKIPIRTRIPLDMKIPLEVPVHVSISRLPVAIDERVAVRLPPIEAPIDTKLNMRVHLFPH